MTNLNAATSFTNATLGTNGVIGKLEEAPDLQVANDRMVIRLTCNADQAAAIKRLLRSTDL